MSYQDKNQLSDKLVRFKEEVTKLKTTQIIGGENMGCFEYVISSDSKQISQYDGRFFFIIVCAEKPFPLVSIELDYYENGVLKQNPYGISPTPNNVAKDSICNCSFMDLSTSGIYTHEVTVDGIVYSADNPKTYIIQIEVSNSRSNNVTVQFKNIRIRTTCLAKCFTYITNTGYEPV